MTGLLTKALTRRYGEPKVVLNGLGSEYRWNDATDGLRCVLYNGLTWDAGLRNEYGLLELVYGTARGGTLLGGSLKAAIIRGQSVFGLYDITTLHHQPEVISANEKEPCIVFFMDASNVWYYGVKGKELYVYDSATGELDLLGPIESKLELLLEEWELTKMESNSH
jgi:hypothetical protein